LYDHTDFWHPKNTRISHSKVVKSDPDIIGLILIYQGQIPFQIKIEHNLQFWKIWKFLKNNLKILEETKASWPLQTVITFSRAIFGCLEIYKLSRVEKLSNHLNNYLSNINCVKTKTKVVQEMFEEFFFFNFSVQI